MLDIKEIFLSIQGEGPFAGTPAWFVRLAECPLRCPGCDTDFRNGQKVGIDFIKGQISVLKEGTVKPRLVVITGGEPLAQDISELCWELMHDGYMVQIETSGVTCHSGNLEVLPFLTIVCSPKTPNLHKGLIPHIDFYKYVCRAGEVDEDGLPVEVMVGHSSIKKVFRDANFISEHPYKVFLQPFDECDSEQNQINLAFAAKVSIKRGFTLTVQIHKLAGLR